MNMARIFEREMYICNAKSMLLTNFQRFGNEFLPFYANNRMHAFAYVWRWKMVCTNNLNSIPNHRHFPVVVVVISKYTQSYPNLI